MLGAAAALATPVGAASESVFAFKAPLLDRILASTDDPEQRAVALDLGGPCQALFDRLCACRRYRVEIADLVNNHGLIEISGLESNDDSIEDSIEHQGRSLMQRLLPAPNDERLDLIFCWDLPNYMSLRALKLLIDVLAQRGRQPRREVHRCTGPAPRGRARSEHPPPTRRN